MQSKMVDPVPELSTVLLTPARLKILEFLQQREIPSLIANFTCVFKLASFFVDHDLEEYERESLFMQHYFIELLNEIQLEV